MVYVCTSTMNGQKNQTNEEVHQHNVRTQNMQTQIHTQTMGCTQANSLVDTDNQTKENKRKKKNAKRAMLSDAFNALHVICVSDAIDATTDHNEREGKSARILRFGLRKTFNTRKRSNILLFGLQNQRVHE